MQSPTECTNSVYDRNEYLKEILVIFINIGDISNIIIDYFFDVFQIYGCGHINCQLNNPVIEYMRSLIIEQECKNCINCNKEIKSNNDIMCVNCKTDLSVLGYIKCPKKECLGRCVFSSETRRVKLRCDSNHEIMSHRFDIHFSTPLSREGKFEFNPYECKKCSNQTNDSILSIITNTITPLEIIGAKDKHLSLFHCQICFNNDDNIDRLCVKCEYQLLKYNMILCIKCCGKAKYVLDTIPYCKKCY